MYTWDVFSGLANCLDAVMGNSELQEMKLLLSPVSLPM